MLINVFCLIETSLYLWPLRPREKIFAYTGTQLRKFKEQYNIVWITDNLWGDESLSRPSKFLRWRLIFVGPQDGPGFMSLFRHLEYWGDSYMLRKFVRLFLKLNHMHKYLWIDRGWDKIGSSFTSDSEVDKTSSGNDTCLL
jgi:hypothetical protein